MEASDGSLARCEGSGASALLVRLDRFCEVLILDGRRYAVILLDDEDRVALVRVVGTVVLCLEVLGCLAGALWAVSSEVRLRVARIVVEEEVVDEDEDSWRVPSMPEEYER